jgi:uncharacterized protein DUF4037
LQYSAALLGSGSEVLGLDTSQSMDHHWGPRLQIFMSEDDYAAHAGRMSEVLSTQLPHHFRGYPTSFGPPDKTGVRLLRDMKSGPVNHRVEIDTIKSFFEDYLGINPHDQVRILDWLTIPEQRLLTVTAGRVYHDGLGKLNGILGKFSYYPRDVWLYMLAAQWGRIGAEDAFIGRSGEVGDDLGSGIIAARLAHSVMKLCFLMEKHYAPYSKWLGTAFARLSCAKSLSPVLEKVLHSRSWQEREQHLSAAYSLMAGMHNGLGITKPLDTQVSPYYNRPYRVIHSERFADAIREVIRDPEVRRKIPIGSIDQYVDCTEIMTNPQLYGKLRVMYDR